MPENAPNSKSASLISRRHFFIGGAFALTSAVALAKQPQVHKPLIPTEKFEGWVPRDFGQWRVVPSSSVVLPPPDELSDRLYDNLVTRTYRGPGDEFVMLLMAYNNRQDGVLQVHRPEVCYPVGGYVLSDNRRVSVPASDRSIPANFFTASAPGRVEQVLYFTRLGGAYPRSWAEQRLAVIQENLAGKIPDGALMRASTLSTDPVASSATLKSFIGEFLVSAPAGLRSLLVA
jgi:EpsI family protein